MNYEWKARLQNLEEAQQHLLAHKPLFKGEDKQTDTYFNVQQGRLKLREGHIENALIHYQRDDSAGARQSQVILYQHLPDAALKETLTAALGIKVIMQKRRRIYFIENVKFHFDIVDGLGTFAEVEAIDIDGRIGIKKLKQQCAFWSHFFKIREADYIAASYSDMLLSTMQQSSPNFPKTL